MPTLASKEKGHPIIINGPRVPRSVLEVRAVLREIAFAYENGSSVSKTSTSKNQK